MSVKPNTSGPDAPARRHQLRRIGDVMSRLSWSAGSSQPALRLSDRLLLVGCGDVHGDTGAVVHPQRGRVETSGMLRQYFPKTTDMAALSQDQLDQAAYSLNSRPRQTLGWMTPSQKLAEALR